MVEENYVLMLGKTLRDGDSRSTVQPESLIISIALNFYYYSHQRQNSSHFVISINFPILATPQTSCVEVVSNPVSCIASDIISYCWLFNSLALLLILLLKTASSCLLVCNL